MTECMEEVILKDFFGKIKNKFTVIDEKTNYSVGDNKYGSIILALGLNSEEDFFGEKCTYQLNQVISGILNDSGDGDFVVSGLRNLDLELTGLIRKKSGVLNKYLTKDNLLDSEAIKNDYGNDISKDDALENCGCSGRKKFIDDILAEASRNGLLDEGATMIMNFTKSKNFENCKRIFVFFLKASILKYSERVGWNEKHWNVVSPRNFRISDHVVATMDLNESMAKYNGMSAVKDEISIGLGLHEIGEVMIGDIAFYDGISSEEKQEIEHRAMGLMLNGLNKGDEYLKMLFAFDEAKESKYQYMYLNDKLVADIFSRYFYDYNMFSDLSMCVSAMNSEKIKEAINLGEITSQYDIWYQYNKRYYEKFPVFTSFMSVFEYLRQHGLKDLLEEQKKYIKEENN